MLISDLFKTFKILDEAHNAGGGPGVCMGRYSAGLLPVGSGGTDWGRAVACLDGARCAVHVRVPAHLPLPKPALHQARQRLSPVRYRGFCHLLLLPHRCGLPRRIPYSRLHGVSQHAMVMICSSLCLSK